MNDTPIIEACDVNPPKPKLASMADDTEVLFIPMAAVDAVSGTVSDPQTRNLGELRKKSYRSLQPGDVIFAKITPCMENGKSAVVPEFPSGVGFGSTEFHVLRPRLGVDAKYVWHFVRQDVFRRHARDAMTGTVGQERVPAAFVAQAPIPLPSEEVQRLTAELLDSAIASAQSAGSHLANATRTVERFRRSILAAACSGRLTVDWRAERRIGEWPVEAASEACAKVQSGKTPKQWYEGPDGIPFLKVYNIVDQKVAFGYRPQFISKAVFAGPMARAEARSGDVLMNIVGPPLGKVAVVTDEYPAWCFNQALTLFRPSPKVTTEWLYIFLCSGISVASVMAATRGTVGQINISLTQCREFEIPLPSIEEQKEIARRVGDLLAIAERASTQLGAAADQVQRSAQSILAKAFRGELTPSTSEDSR